MAAKGDTHGQVLELIARREKGDVLSSEEAETVEFFEAGQAPSLSLWGAKILHAPEGKFSGDSVEHWQAKLAYVREGGKLHWRGWRVDEAGDQIEPATLREFLEARWAERRGTPIIDALTDFGVPQGGPDGIEMVGAERVRDRTLRWAERGLPPAIDGEPPEAFVIRLREYEDYFGALWLDAFVAGLVFAARER